MARLTMNGIWEDTRAVARRHFGAFATFAAAFAFLPPLALRVLYPELMSGVAPQDAMPPAGFFPAVLATSLLSFLGMFAIVAIAADPAEGGGRPAGELFAGALRGFGKFLLACLLIYVGVLLAMIVCAIAVGVIAALAGGMGSLTRSPAVAPSPAASVVAMLFLAIILPLTLWLVARLAPMAGVFVREAVGVTDGVRRSWSLSRGAAGPIIGLLLVFVFASLAIGLAGMGLGAAFGVAGSVASGSAKVGALLFAIVSSALGALLFIYYATATGVIYRQLAAPPS